MVDVLLTDKLSVPLMDVNIKLIYTTLAIVKCGFNRRLDIGARLGLNSHNESYNSPATCDHRYFLIHHRLKTTTRVVIQGCQIKLLANNSTRQPFFF